MERKEISVALVGNPNSGKTSLFNKLVGGNQRVGNFSGVTVEKYEGTVSHNGYEIKIIDLPGTYSLTTYSPEEVITRQYILTGKPDVVVNVVDSTNLERNLYLTTQLIDVQANLLVALNMYDELEKQETIIDLEQLEKLLGTHLIPTSAVTGLGINDLLNHIVDLFTDKISIKKNKLTFSALMEEYIEKIISVISKDEELSQKYYPRWLAIKLLVNDKDVYKIVKEYPVWIKVNNILAAAIKEIDQKFDSDPELMLKEERHALIRGAIKETVKYPQKKKMNTSEVIDSILINRITGLPLFIFFMWGIFQLTFTLGEAPMNWIDTFFSWFGSAASMVIKEPTARSIVVDGIIAGVGGVLVFLPNIMILFFSLSFLEGTGYMARAAFVIDKVMHKVGLHGKSFIPMITGFGCSVPAFMATRTLRNKSDRITTLLIIPFMSCSAKFPVYILIAGTFFGASQAGNALFGIYMLGILIALITARLLKTAVFKGESEPFVMELPPYRMPSFKVLIMQMWQKASLYLRKAGTIILTASILIWVASNYPKSEEITVEYSQIKQDVTNSSKYDENEKKEIFQKLNFQEGTKQLEYSFAGRLGKLLEPVVAPLGFDWKLGIALISGIAAKEIVVSTMGTLYSLGDVDENSHELRERLLANPDYNQAVALSLMVFVLLYIPCAAATIVFHKEAGEWKWTAFYASYTMTVAWIMSYLTYNISKYFLL
ncbi:MAG: ferrous iron transport protein B [Bacteroidetes bacterium]|nr:ferrous iron transport protein B [Nanoarchaeota archaeon]MBU1116847.1 ferrous iron transport protein B [Bacteroidota bacterium]MBU1798044.1 ferrous iron transport protein B [Bacteroidota bacterium]